MNQPFCPNWLNDHCRLASSSESHQYKSSFFFPYIPWVEIIIKKSLISCLWVMTSSYCNPLPPTVINHHHFATPFPPLKWWRNLWTAPYMRWALLEKISALWWLFLYFFTTWHKNLLNIFTKKERLSSKLNFEANCLNIISNQLI